VWLDSCSPGSTYVFTGAPSYYLGLKTRRAQTDSRVFGGNASRLRPIHSRYDESVINCPLPSRLTVVWNEEHACGSSLLGTLSEWTRR
jgi:hypothetical protein